LGPQFNRILNFDKKYIKLVKKTRPKEKHYYNYKEFKIRHVKQMVLINKNKESLKNIPETWELSLTRILDYFKNLDNHSCPKLSINSEEESRCDYQVDITKHHPIAFYSLALNWGLFNVEIKKLENIYKGFTTVINIKANMNLNILDRMLLVAWRGVMFETSYILINESKSKDVKALVKKYIKNIQMLKPFSMKGAMEMEAIYQIESMKPAISKNKVPGKSILMAAGIWYFLMDHNELIQIQLEYLREEIKDIDEFEKSKKFMFTPSRTEDYMDQWNFKNNPKLYLYNPLGRKLLQVARPSFTKYIERWKSRLELHIILKKYILDYKQ